MNQKVEAVIAAEPVQDAVEKDIKPVVKTKKQRRKQTNLLRRV